MNYSKIASIVITIIFSFFSQAPAYSICILACKVQRGIENAAKNIPTSYDLNHNLTITNVQEVEQSVNHAMSQLDQLRGKTTGDLRSLIEQTSTQLNSLLRQNQELFRQNGEQLISQLDQVSQQRLLQIAVIAEQVNQDAEKLINLWAEKTNELIDEAELSGKVLIDRAESSGKVLIKEIDDAAKSHIRYFSQESHLIVKAIDDSVEHNIIKAGDELESLIKISGEEFNQQAEIILSKAGEEIATLSDDFFNQAEKRILSSANKHLESLITLASAEASAVSHEIINQMNSVIEQRIQQINYTVKEGVNEGEISRTNVVVKFWQGTVYTMERGAELTLIIVSFIMGVILVVVVGFGFAITLVKNPLPNDKMRKSFIFGGMVVASLMPIFCFTFVFSPAARSSILINSGQFTEQKLEKLLNLEPKIWDATPTPLILSNQVHDSKSEVLLVRGANFKNGLIANYGNISLPILRQTDNLLAIDVRSVYQNSPSGSRINIYNNSSNGNPIYSVAVIDNQSNLINDSPSVSSITSSLPEEPIYLKSSCGKYSFPENVESIKVYKVYIPYTPQKLATLKSNFCEDAWQPHKELIQVAVFDDYSKAEDFRGFISEQLDTRGEIQEDTLKNKDYREPTEQGSSAVDTLGNTEITLNEDRAISIIEKFYHFISTEQYNKASQLYTSQLTSTFDYQFFKKFKRITVENLQIESKTDSMINFQGINTYVYHDGKTQRELRSYTVRNINGEPKITASEFIKVIKFRK